LFSDPLQPFGSKGFRKIEDRIVEDLTRIVEDLTRIVEDIEPYC